MKKEMMVTLVRNTTHDMITILELEMDEDGKKRGKSGNSHWACSAILQELSGSRYPQP